MHVHHQSRFLDLQALSALTHLRFTTRRRIDGQYSGRHRSRQLGGAGEFVDFREYTAGDDLRRLDWKVLARTGKRYLRLFQDETNLSCLILVDASGSMRFGGTQTAIDGPGSKLEFAQYFSTALSHLIVHGQDQVGLAIVSDKLRKFIPPGSSSEHLARVHTAIEKLQTQPETQLALAMRELFQRLSRRGVLLIISDFLCDSLEETFAAIRLYRARFWETVVLHLVHPEEERLPEGTALRFEGLENDGRVDCSPAEIVAEYEARFEAYCAAVRSLAIATGSEYRRVSTAVPYVQALRGFLVERTG
ncbi:MAG: DUF58 domain-containing protein [Planctomycetaceae bacterium]|nr:MAG: DUF58 domain-containing protein [Planctomycetaceae bacterium]